MHEKTLHVGVRWGKGKYPDANIRVFGLHFILPSENLTAILGDKHSNFPLGGESSIFCVDGPAVALIAENFLASHINHRLDGKDHAGNHEHFRARLGDIADPGFFVELDANAMAADLPHNTVAIFKGVGVNSGAHVAKKCPGGGPWRFLSQHIPW